MTIRVEVVYALADMQRVIEVELNEGARVADALAAAILRDEVFGQSLPGLRIGIWGKPASSDTGLRDRDRVEIYRELQADPKQVRRQRAKLQRPLGSRR
jgi:putative ubiquitin-RnfH superfamily antitoxin RatB of RatAB toxin-antitoxin module